MITTYIECSNCPAHVQLRHFSAEPHNVVLRADSIQPGWKFAPDGGHLCPDCDDYDEEAQR